MTHIDKSVLKKMVPQFHRFLEAEGKQWKEERAEKDGFFATYFAEDRIDDLEEGTLRELIHILWAFNSWTNKDWLLQEMLRSGLPTIKRLFRQLLYGDGSMASRFDNVRKGGEYRGWEKYTMGGGGDKETWGQGDTGWLSASPPDAPIHRGGRERQRDTGTRRQWVAVGISTGRPDSSRGWRRSGLRGAERVCRYAWMPY